MPPKLTDHASMSFDGGSQVFIVDKKRFQIPRQSLALHSEVFADMFRLASGPSEPITLQDSQEAFEAFCDAITTPYRSCLFVPNPPLQDVLNVLTISHKYCVTDLEQQASTIMMTMLRPEAMNQHLTPQLPLERVVVVALEAGCDEVAEVAWAIAMNDFQAKRRPVRAMLSFADDVKSRRPDLAAQAYYETMIRGPASWKVEPSLTDAQKITVATGAVACADAFDKIMRDWKYGSIAARARHKCPSNPDEGCTYTSHIFISRVSYACTDAVGSCNILGRLEIAANLMPPRSPPRGGFAAFAAGQADLEVSDCHCAAVKAAEALLAAERTRLSSYFWGS